MTSSRSPGWTSLFPIMQAATTGEISHTVAEVVRSSTKITGAVKEVASTADNNREEAGRALEGAVCLSDLTMRMQDLISRFKLIPA